MLFSCSFEFTCKSITYKYILKCLHFTFFSFCCDNCINLRQIWGNGLFFVASSEELGVLCKQSAPTGRARS